MTLAGPVVTDVHQHLWPESLIEGLRARRALPRLRGWTLETEYEPPFEVDPASHHPALRRTADRDAGIGQSILGLSSPLGIELMRPDEAHALLDAWHRGALALGDGHGVWAAAGLRELDPAAVSAMLVQGCVGLQVPATGMSSPRQLERVAPLLEVCQQQNRPVLVHPGPAAATPNAPGWWAPVVDYTAQMAAAWWAWYVEGRRLLPNLRICFVAGAGLAPVHHERLTARGGRCGVRDPAVFVDTSSYGPQGVGALVRVLGIDSVVLGSDRPYAEPTDPDLGAAAAAAIRCTNPRRLLRGARTRLASRPE